jgi:SanA protein
MDRILIKRTRMIVIYTLLALIAVSSIINVYMTSYVKNYLYDDISSLPYNKTGVVLGTSKYRRGGDLNPYYSYRINAAAKLYKSGKVSFILASGDNMSKFYNEPKQMRQDLISQGVPKNIIYLDYAGFRTLDSVVRSNRIFDQTSITIITQKFHNQRAVFIARHFGINAVGFNAEDITDSSGFKTRFREFFAKVKAAIDLYITGKKPKYLGDKINIK